MRGKKPENWEVIKGGKPERKPKQLGGDVLARGSKRIIDWGVIELHYRANQLSVAEISRQTHVSRAAIDKRAKRDGWERDLASRVQAKVASGLLRDAAPEGAQDDEAVDLAAARAIEVVRQHRALLGQLNRIVTRMTKDIELNLTGQLIVIPWMRPFDTVASVVVRLAQALGKAIPLERQAFAVGVPIPKNPKDRGAVTYPAWREIFERAGLRYPSDPSAG